MMVIMIAMVVWIKMMYIEKEQNLCWFCFPTYTPKKKSQYVIVGPLLVLPICSTYYCSKTLANIPKKRIFKLDIFLLDNATTLCEQVIREPATQAFYINIYLPHSQKVIQPIYTCGLWYN